MQVRCGLGAYTGRDSYSDGDGSSGSSGVTSSPEVVPMRTRRVVWRPAVTQNDLDEVTGELTRPHWRIKRWQWLCGASNNAPTEDEAELVQHDGTRRGS